MLNQTGIKKVTGAAPVQILFDAQHYVAVSIKVAKTMASVTVDGRKIVKAGTPLTGDLTNRSTAFKAPVAASEGVTAQPAVGVLLHDVDITDKNANATLLIWGFVNLSRLDTATQALATAAKSALDGKIWFLKDN